MIGLNLHNLVNSLIASIVQNQNIIICTPITSQDADNNIINTYTQIGATCQIQLANNQQLKHKDYYQQNQIYKRFYIANDQLTGLNRNIDASIDYLIWNNLTYRIVEVNYNFQTGWINLVGCESSDFTSG